jgi:hypothetical protein
MNLQFRVIAYEDIEFLDTAEFAEGKENSWDVKAQMKNYLGTNCNLYSIHHLRNGFDYEIGYFMLHREEKRWHLGYGFIAKPYRKKGYWNEVMYMILEESQPKYEEGGGYKQLTLRCKPEMERFYQGYNLETFEEDNTAFNKLMRPTYSKYTRTSGDVFF